MSTASPRPHCMLRLLPDVVPDDLKELDQWVLWRYELKHGRWTKVPYQLNGEKASSTDPRTWSSFEKVCQAYERDPERFNGIGFVFTADDPFVGADLDNCIDETGALKPWARPIVERFGDTYTEKSPSGKGLKIFAKGTLPGKGKKRPFEDGQIEIYDQARFFTLTGNVWNGAPSELEEHDSDIEELYRSISNQNDSGHDGAAPSGGSKEKDGKILKGQRHNTLISLAGSMRNRGMSPAAIDAALQVENSTRCIPPYDAAHVSKIAEDAGKWKPGESASNSALSEWPEPIPFIRTPPDSIPTNCLPGWLGEMAAAVSDATETPFELPALLAIAIVSSCVAAKAVVSPEPGYSEPLNIYVCPAMESGNRKTAVFTALLDPLIKYERSEIERMQPERKRLQSERRTMESRIERLRKKASPTDNAHAQMQEILQLENSLPEIPSLPRLFSDDITPERLASLMHEQNEKLAVFSDEGGVFDMLAGRYSNGVPNLDLWLKGHSASPVRVDRQDKAKPPICMDRPHLTVGISPQPDVLGSLRDKPGFRGRGLLARWLYALPQSRLGHRTLEPKPVPPDLQSRYRNGLQQLLEYRPETELYLRLGPSAYREWKDFQRALEPQFREGGMLQDLKDWGGKLAGAALRLAGIYHMVLESGRTAVDVEIPATTMSMAIEVATCLISHAHSVFALMDLDPAIQNAEKLLRWITRQGKSAFAVRECFRAHQSRFQRVDAMLPVLVLIEQHGYIRRVQQNSSGGRPPSDLYEVNPAILPGGAQ